MADSFSEERTSIGRAACWWMTLAHALVIVAIVDVAMGIWHRHKIDLEWDQLRSTSRPPLEAYETYGIDFEAEFVRVPVDCSWLILQVTSFAIYLATCRKAGWHAGLVFLSLWLLSVFGIAELTFSILSLYRYP